MNNIFKVNTIEELKSLGTLKAVQDAYKEAVAPFGMKGKTNSWANMLASINEARELVEKLAELTGYEPKKAEPQQPAFDDPYFKSESAKIIYALLNMSGEQRTSVLGINERLYENNAEARHWYTRICKLVHPDNCNHPYATRAFAEASRIYNRMQKGGKVNTTTIDDVTWFHF